MSRLEGVRARSTERLYRSFLRELPAIARGSHSPSRLRVPTKLVFGQKDVVLSTRAVKDAAAQTDMVELELVADRLLKLLAT
jgi:hypothetical protein